MADTGSANVGGHLGHLPQGNAIPRSLVLALLLTCTVLPPFWASVSPSVQGLDWMISKCPSRPDLQSRWPGGLLVAVITWQWRRRERWVVMSRRPQLHSHARVWAPSPGFCRDTASSLFCEV